MAFNLHRGALWADSRPCFADWKKGDPSGNLSMIAILQNCPVALPSLVCAVHSDLPLEFLQPDEDLIELDHQHKVLADPSLISSLALWEGQSLA